MGTVIFGCGIGSLRLKPMNINSMGLRYRSGAQYKRLFPSTISHIWPMALIATTASTKAGDHPDNGLEQLVLEIRIHSKGLDAPTPSIPKTHPLLGSRCHASNANGSISSLEVTFVAILGDTTKSCQHIFCGSGK